MGEAVDCGYLAVEKVTRDALLLVDEDGDTYWIPKSQIADESDIDKESEEGDEGVLFLPEWLAIEKGLA